MEIYNRAKMPKNAGRFEKTFNDKEIEELKNYIIDIDKSFWFNKKLIR